MSAVVLVGKGISCKLDWTGRNAEDKFTKNLIFFSSSAFLSFPHVNTHGPRLGAWFHWAPLRRVMRDEIRGSLLHMAHSAHARGSATDASTCRFNTLTSCQAEVRISLNRTLLVLVKPRWKRGCCWSWDRQWIPQISTIEQFIRKTHSLICSIAPNF